MPYLDMDDPGWVRLQERLAQALSSFAADLGGRVCAHGSWVDCDAGEDGNGCLFDDTQPSQGMPVLAEFVLIVNVTDMGKPDGESTTGVVAAPRQRNTTTKGLLHVALYE